MDITNITPLGFQWIKCPFEWGLEDYVTIITENSGRLILVNAEKHVTTKGSQWSTDIKYTPVLSDDLPELKGNW